MIPFKVKRKGSDDVFSVLHIFSDSDGAILCLVANVRTGVIEQVHLNRLRENYLLSQ